MTDAHDRVRPLLRVRQTREFADAPVDPAALDAIADAGRWSGSARNSQPWRFIVVSDAAVLRSVAEAGMPHTRALMSAAAAIAVVMPRDSERAVTLAYDEGRAAERMLIAAHLVGLAAGIGWIRPDVHDQVAAILGIPSDHRVRTIVAIGHPTEAARRPKSAPGEARLPREETVFAERWRA